MEETIDIASETLKELYYQREIIEKTLVQQSNIHTIYNKCQNILKSMNDSFYRLFFKNEKIETESYNNTRSIEIDSEVDRYTELQKIKKINLLINKELDRHNNILETSNKFKLRL
jgi:hypothetical protein